MVEIYEYNTDSGIVIPQTSDIKSQVQSEWQAALGSDLSLVDSTPQGVLIQNDTDYRTAIITANANMVNGYNIFYAQGIQLDAIGLTFGVVRRTAQSTLVTATCYGVPNTTILTGSLVQTTNGDIFVSLAPAVINQNGYAEVYFASQETGAVACPEGALSFIISEIDGWERVTNSTAGILGYDVESDYSYRLRILVEYQKARGFIESFKGRLSEVSGLTDSLVLENYENVPRIIRGIDMPPHSVVIIANGGLDTDVISACFNSKDAGSAYTAITATHAFGYIVFADNFTSGDTITIGSNTITAGTDFVIGVSLNNSLKNLVKNVSITGFVLTTEDSNATTLYINASASGDTGNSVAISSSVGTVSGDTLAGGFTQDVSVTGTIIDVYDIPNTVIFNRPYVYKIAIKAVIKNNFYAGSNLKSAVENAIISWANNEVESVEGLKLGGNINAWEISAAITDIIPECKIQSIYIGMATGIQATGSILFANNLSADDTITIGNTTLTAGVDFLIGDTLDDTLQNIISVNVEENILTASEDTLFVTYKYSGTIGNSETLATTALNATVKAMSGGVNNVTPSLLNINTGTAIIGSVAIADMEIVVI